MSSSLDLEAHVTGGTALPSRDGPDPSFGALEDTLAELTLCGYQCVPGPLLPTAKRPASSTDLQIGDLVWVLKSKGRRRKANGSDAVPGTSTATTRTTTTTPTAPSEGTVSTPVSSQRFELFSRARIVSNPENTRMDGEKTDDNNRNIQSTQCAQRHTERVNHNKNVGFDDNVTTPTSSSSSSSSSRVWIQYPKGSTYHVKCDHICRVMEHEHGSIVVWPETDVYRKSCLTHTRPANEAFVEIGCDHGPTVDRIATSMMDPTLVLGIDKASDSIASARQRRPQYTFIQWDCLAEVSSSSSSSSIMIPPELQDLIQRRSRSFHLAIDINGNRELTAVLACLRRLLVDLELRPRLVFVKSRALFHELMAREGRLS